MDGALTAITLLSLATTGAVLYYAARLLREDRDRSEARVAALAEEIHRRPARPDALAWGEPDAPLFRRAARGHDEIPTAEPPTADAGHVRLVPLPGHDDVRSHEQPQAAPRSWPPPEEPEAAPAGEPDVHVTRLGESPSAKPSANTTWFDRADEDVRTPSRPWLIPAVGALVVGLVLAVVYLSSGSGGGSGRAQAASAGESPLELLSLRHTRGAETLTVSGLVRNPRTGGARAGVTAVVFLFGKDGAFAASGRAPLDFQSMAPGDESPFIVSIPVTGPVTRYRVSFRTDAAVVPHVDARDGVRLAEK